MLPKSEGPTDVKRKRLPDIKVDLLDMADSHISNLQEPSTLVDADEATETALTNESTLSGSYASSGDFGYSSHESSLQFSESLCELSASEGDNLLPTLSDKDLGCDFEPLDPDNESLLIQFDKFFRQKMDDELSAMRENMHSLLSEQQIHVRKLISSSSCPQQTPMKSKVGEARDTDEEERDLPIRDIFSTEDCSMEESRQEAEKRVKTGLIIELLSLSCQITELLNHREYKS